MPHTGQHEGRLSYIKQREQWTGKLDFILSLLGYAVGLGNVWRFPYLAYKNGGGAFFVPYFISLFFVGIPIFLLELSLGQYSSAGPTTCWEFCPLIQGCGFSVSLVAAFVSSYYNVIIAWALFFFFASFTSELPWESCGEWSTKYCSGRVRYMTAQQCVIEKGTVSKGLCEAPENVTDDIWIVDREVAKANGVKVIFPAMEYFNRRVTGLDFSDIANPGAPRGDLVLCLILAWIIVGACLSKGIKTSGKVVYVTATTPYVMLAVLLVRGLMLEGSGDGILYFLTPRAELLKDSTIWKDAAVQIFYSLSASDGGLIMLASYNKFHNDIVHDALVVSVCNSLTSIFAGFVIFSYLGFLAHDMQVPIDEVTVSGVTLAFGMYPFCLSKLPSSSLWSAIFFIMLVLLGVDSQFVLVETVITAIIDTTKMKAKKHWVVVGVCTALCLVGLSMTTNSGPDVLTIIDAYATSWNVLTVAAVESFTISWVYGGDRFIEDVSVMLGGQICEKISFKPLCALWWRWCWAILTPMFAVSLVIFSLVDYGRIEHLPWWVDIIGWTISIACGGTIVLVGVIKLVRTEGTLNERFRYLTTPTRYWGPALVEHRMLVQKVRPEIIVNPYEDDVSIVVPPPETEVAIEEETAKATTAQPNEPVERNSVPRSEN